MPTHSHTQNVLCPPLDLSFPSGSLQNEAALLTIGAVLQTILKYVNFGNFFAILLLRQPHFPADRIALSEDMGRKFLLSTLEVVNSCSHKLVIRIRNSTNNFKTISRIVVKWIFGIIRPFLMNTFFKEYFRTILSGE